MGPLFFIVNSERVDLKFSTIYIFRITFIVLSRLRSRSILKSPRIARKKSKTLVWNISSFLLPRELFKGFHIIGPPCKIDSHTNATGNLNLKQFKIILLHLKKCVNSSLCVSFFLIFKNFIQPAHRCVYCLKSLFPYHFYVLPFIL